MRGSTSVWSALACACLCLGALAGCTESDVLAEVDGAHHVRLLHQTNTSLGGSGNHFVCSPKLIKHRSLVLEVDRERHTLHGFLQQGDPALELDEAGQRLALRFGEGPWYLFYLEGERALPSSPLPALTQGALDWGQAPTWPQAARAICRANHNSCDEVWEIHRQDPAALQALLVELIDMDWGSTHQPDRWTSGLRRLDEASQAQVLAQVAPRLRPGVEPPVLARLLHHLELSPEQRQVAMAQASALPLERPQARDAWLRLHAQAALEGDPQASERVCQRWRALSCPPDPDRHSACVQAQGAPLTGQLGAPLLVLASQGATCPALRAALPEVAPCDPRRRCGQEEQAVSTRPLCTQAQAQGRARAWLQGWLAARGKPRAGADQALLWRMASEPTEPAVERANQRRAYSVQAQEPGCDRAARAGQACTADPDALREAACALEGDRGLLEEATFQVSDAERRIHGVQARYAGQLEQIYGGFAGACGLTAGGELQCWRNDGLGARDALWGAAPSRDRLRLGPPPARRSHLAPGGAPRALSVSHPWRLCAVNQAGELWCSLREGDGLEKQLEGAVDVAVTRNQICALLEGGALTCWRAAQGPQARDVPAALAGRVFSQVDSALSLLCAQEESGALWCWDDQAGDGQQPPQQVLEGEAGQQLQLWVGGACLWRAGGKARCWERSPARQSGWDVPASVKALRLSGGGAWAWDGEGLSWRGWEQPQEARRVEAPPLRALGELEAYGDRGPMVVLTPQGEAATLWLSRPSAGPVGAGEAP